MTTWLKDGCCARRWFAAAVLSLSCTVSASESCAQEVTAYPKHPPAASDGTIDNLEVWKRVTLGTRKGVDDYRQALERAAIKIGDSADLGRPILATTPPRRTRSSSRSRSRSSAWRGKPNRLPASISARDGSVSSFVPPRSDRSCAWIIAISRSATQSISRWNLSPRGAVSS